MCKFKVFILVCVEMIGDGLGFSNLTKVIMNALLKGGGVNKGRIVQEALVFWTKWGECVSR
jgi:hypothetical protein